MEATRERWSQVSLFGVYSDDLTPRVWGNRIKASRHRASEDSCNTDEAMGSTIRRSTTSVLTKMVKQHTYQEEMKMQLRDERIRLSYLDTFESDIDRALAASEHYGPCGRFCFGSCVVRVFSFGATLLEYLKIVLAVWTFGVALIVVSFWEVLKPLSEQKTLLYVDLGVDVVFAICLAVQLRTTILVVQTGREYCMPQRILRAHLSDVRFWMDVVSCVPLVLFEMFAGGGRTRLALIKALRGWRICRIPPEKQFVPSNTFLVLQLAGFILMGGHLLACIWFSIVYAEGTMMLKVPLTSVSEEVTNPHAARYEVCLGENAPGCFGELYTVAILHGVYLLMGIDRDAHSAWEHLFVTLCAPVGLLVHACMLGEIVLLIQRRGALETRQNEQTLAIQEAMRILGLPPNLQMRIIAFFTYERIHRSGRLFDALFAHLSPQLRFELHLHLYLGLVRQSKLFRRTRPRVIREIVLKLQDVIFIPGDWVCRYGDYGDSMYFIVAGKCVVIAEDTETELQTLERGRYFGEVALLTSRPRTAYVRANTFCLMAQLTKEGFAPIVRQWPEEIDVLIEEVEKDSDKIKIKAEASRHYGLRRSSSLNGTARHSGTCFEADGIHRSSVGEASTASNAMRRDSRLSLSSVASSTCREAFNRKWSQDCSPPAVGGIKGECRDQHSGAQGQAVLKHSSSAGPLTLRELRVSKQEIARRATSCSDLDLTNVIPSHLAWMGKAEDTAVFQGDGKLDFRPARSLLSSPPPRLHPTLLGSGFVGSALPETGEEDEDCDLQPSMLSCNGGCSPAFPPLSSPDAVVLEEDSINAEAEHPPTSAPASPKKEKEPEQSGKRERLERRGTPVMLEPQEVLEAASVTELAEVATEPSVELEASESTPTDRRRLTEQEHELQHRMQLQSQISDIADNLGQLQEEVSRQREFLTQSLADLKNCTVDAVREAVSQQLRSSGTRRSSVYSDDSNGWSNQLPGSASFSDAGISTPFT